MKTLKRLTAALSVALALNGALTLSALAANAPDQADADIAAPSVTVTDASPQSEDTPLTRGALITALHQAAGSPVVNYAMSYSDVSEEDPEAEAIRWASSEKIAYGFEDGSFRPDDPLTREQAAVILYRHAQSCSRDFTGCWAFRLPYSDTAEIHDFAFEAVSWMTMHEIMGPVSGDAFAPRQTLTAAEGKEILVRYTEAVELDADTSSALAASIDA